VVTRCRSDIGNAHYTTPHSVSPQQHDTHAHDTRTHDNTTHDRRGTDLALLRFDSTADHACLEVVHLLVGQHDEADLELALPVALGQEQVVLVVLGRRDALDLA
jgi:hypothetical protein